MNISSLFSTFGIDSQITTINSEICEVVNPNFDSKITICHKALTFGGRDNIPDELRVQIMYENNNLAFHEYEATGHAALLGIHDSEDIVCAWKLKLSNATQGTISKQIKRKYIDEAKKIGFVQAPPNRSGEYVCVFRKEFIYFYLKNSSWLHDEPVRNLNEHFVPNNEEVISSYNSIDEGKRIEGGVNVLLYGVPGSGKSWTIEHEYCKPGSVVERLVFHPDYTYSDFIGQILPAVDEDGQVSYKFTPGPFTNILREAYNHPGTEYILIIEEINRGNAPAIFGEVFQLLDRKVEIRDVNDDGFPVGTSEYGITNGYKESDVMYTLNATEQHAVAFAEVHATLSANDGPKGPSSQMMKNPEENFVGEPSYGIGRPAMNQGYNAKFSFQIEEEVEPTLVASGASGVAHPRFSSSKASFFTEANEECANTLVATDYKDPPIVNDGDDVDYIVRRLTPTECARLQGFPDWWCDDLGIPDPTDEDIAKWREIFNTHAKAMGKSTKPKTDNQIRKWLQNPQSDSAEYKMWGNGVALPNVYFVLSGIMYYAQECAGK